MMLIMIMTTMIMMMKGHEDQYRRMRKEAHE